MRILRFFRYAAWYCRHAWLLYFVRDGRTRTVREWQRARGDSNLRVNYSLTRANCVLDLGGYEGDWAAAISEAYGCRIYVFEPIPQYCVRIRERFKGHPEICVFEFGLAGYSSVETISIAGESSSLHRAGGNHVSIRLVGMGEFLSRNAIEHIDLIKINIEGAEYDLLDQMFADGIVDRCVDLQIQFHDFVPAAGDRRESIRRRLARTQALTYDFAFVWENWRRNDPIVVQLQSNV